MSIMLCFQKISIFLSWQIRKTDKKKFWDFVGTKKDLISITALVVILQMCHLKGRIATVKETCAMDLEQWCFQWWQYPSAWLHLDSYDWDAVVLAWLTKSGSTFRAEINMIRNKTVKNNNANPATNAFKILIDFLCLYSQLSLSTTASGLMNLSGTFPYLMK